MYGSYFVFVSSVLQSSQKRTIYVADFLIFIIRRKGLGAGEESHAHDKWDRFTCFREGRRRNNITRDRLQEDVVPSVWIIPSVMEGKGPRTSLRCFSGEKGSKHIIQPTILQAVYINKLCSYNNIGKREYCHDTRDCHSFETILLLS